MGQAKNRGSFEKRKAESIIRDSTALGKEFGMPIAEVSPDVFVHLFNLGTAAGLSATTGSTITLDSVNQALHAAIRALAHMQVDGKEAYLARLSCLRALFDQERFRPHFQQNEDGHVFVKNTLLKAMAIAPCTTQWSEPLQSAQARFDLIALERAVSSFE
jgi:hypothetical protein